MKKILILTTFIALFIGACCTTANAQTTTTNEIVELNSLTPELQALVKAEQAKDNDLAKVVMKYKNDISPEEIEGWGDLVNKSLMSVVESAEKFGETQVGRFTMFIIAWKLIGVDFIRIFLGLLFFSVLAILLSRFYKRTIPDRRVLIKRTPQGAWKRDIREYKIVESELDGSEKGWLVIGLIVVFLIGIWITYGIMF